MNWPAIISATVAAITVTLLIVRWVGGRAVERDRLKVIYEHFRPAGPREPPSLPEQVRDLTEGQCHFRNSIGELRAGQDAVREDLRVHTTEEEVLRAEQTAAMERVIDQLTAGHPEIRVKGTQ